MTEHELGTTEAYNTLGCEICLYAYNDYIRQSIDLYCLKHLESEKPWVKDRNRRLMRNMRTRIRWRYLRYREMEDTPRNARLFNRETGFLMSLLEGDIAMIKMFFLEPSPIVGLIGLNGENVLKKADKMVERWKSGERIRLKNSVRSVFYEELEEMDD